MVRSHSESESFHDPSSLDPAHCQSSEESFLVPIIDLLANPQVESQLETQLETNSQIETNSQLETNSQIETNSQLETNLQIATQTDELLKEEKASGANHAVGQAGREPTSDPVSRFQAEPQDVAHEPPPPVDRGGELIGESHGEPDSRLNAESVNSVNSDSGSSWVAEPNTDTPLEICPEFEATARDVPPPSIESNATPRRLKLSTQTLRQRTSIAEFVEPVAPTKPAPPQPTPRSSLPRIDPDPIQPIASPTPAQSSHAIVPASEARLTELEIRLLNLESQLDFSDAAEAKDKQKKLMPLIDEILSSLTPTALRQETIRSIIPVIDRIIIERSEQNRDAMSAAISDLMPQAIARQIESDPHAIAEAVAPEMAEAIRRQIALKKGVFADAISSEMGEAIRRQILLAREEMVDALYPVIGNTITKYMSEEIRNINAKVEQSFSLEGITRKIRAKLQGVSEAELILRDAASFTVKAAFLIHKESGLIIAEAQQPHTSPLESDMIGGMLTAIRSFANDCIAQADAGNTAELNEIEYDTFKLVLEVAGYCYVALVVKGAITKPYVNHMRLVMIGLVQDYGSAIKDFDGDPSTIPEDIAETDCIRTY